jgi:hypothetical protein
MKRLRQLEEENGKLKKIVADLSRDKEVLQGEADRNRSGGLISGRTSAENSRVYSTSAHCRLDASDLAGSHQLGVRCAASRAVDLSLQTAPSQVSRTETEDHGDRTNTRALRLSSNYHKKIQGWLALHELSALETRRYANLR